MVSLIEKGSSEQRTTEVKEQASQVSLQRTFQGQSPEILKEGEVARALRGNGWRGELLEMPAGSKEGSWKGCGPRPLKGI